MGNNIVTFMSVFVFKWWTHFNHYYAFLMKKKQDILIKSQKIPVDANYMNDLG